MMKFLHAWRSGRQQHVYRWIEILIFSLSFLLSACTGQVHHVPLVSGVVLHRQVYHLTGRSSSIKGVQQGPFTFFTLAPSDSGIENMLKGPDGALWFEQGTEGLIGRITAAGQLTTFSLHGIQGPVGTPVWMTVGPDHALWLTDTAAVERMTLDGTLTVFALPTLDEGPLEITPGPDGALWFLEIGSQSLISRLTLQGVLTRFPLASRTTGSIASGPRGSLWFLADAPAGIGQITTAGKLSQFPLPRSIGGNELMAGPDGNLWFSTDQGITQQIGRMLPDGHTTLFSLGRTCSIQQIASDGYGSLVFTAMETNLIGFMTVQGKVSKMFPLPQADVYPLALATVKPGEYWFAETSQGNTSSRKNMLGLLRTS
ncbi:MAG TPA: hypothetical protein VGF67_06170 [Ktedonobacteraceae bacterium]|jgi:virginiamycin B lyase